MKSGHLNLPWILTTLLKWQQLGNETISVTPSEWKSRETCTSQQRVLMECRDNLCLWFHPKLKFDLLLTRILCMKDILENELSSHPWSVSKHSLCAALTICLCKHACHHLSKAHLKFKYWNFHGKVANTYDLFSKVRTQSCLEKQPINRHVCFISSSNHTISWTV